MKSINDATEHEKVQTAIKKVNDMKEQLLKDIARYKVDIDNAITLINQDVSNQEVEDKRSGLIIQKKDVYKVTEERVQKFKERTQENIAKIEEAIKNNEFMTQLGLKKLQNLVLYSERTLENDADNVRSYIASSGYINQNRKNNISNAFLSLEKSLKDLWARFKNFCKTASTINYEKQIFRAAWNEPLPGVTATKEMKKEEEKEKGRITQETKSSDKVPAKETLVQKKKRLDKHDQRKDEFENAEDNLAASRATESLEDKRDRLDTHLKKPKH